MPTHPKKGAGHPWSGYDVKLKKRGFRAWQFRLVSKLGETVFVSEPKFPRQVDAQEQAKIKKAELIKEQQQ